jgi:hypothetical protein
MTKQTYDYVVITTDNEIVDLEGGAICCRNSLLIEALESARVYRYTKREYYSGADNMFEYTNVPYDVLDEVIEMIKSSSYFRDNVQVKLVEFRTLEMLYPRNNDDNIITKPIYDYVIFTTNEDDILNEHGGGFARNQALVDEIDQFLRKYDKRDFNLGDDTTFEYVNVPGDKLNQTIDMIKSTPYFRDDVEVKLVDFRILDTLYPKHNESAE